MAPCKINHLHLLDIPVTKLIPINGQINSSMLIGKFRHKYIKSRYEMLVIGK